MLCRGEGQCPTSCATSDDCAVGTMCNDVGACVGVSRAALPSSGCAFTARGDARGALVLTGIVALACARRRQRKRLVGSSDSDA